MNLYVSNLSYTLTDDDLRAAFEAFGLVQSARVILDKETGRSRGFGFVEMPNNDEGNAAINALNGADLGGRPARVSEARAREERPGGFPGGGGGGGRGGYGGGGGGGARPGYGGGGGGGYGGGGGGGGGGRGAYEGGGGGGRGGYGGGGGGGGQRRDKDRGWDRDRGGSRGGGGGGGGGYSGGGGDDDGGW